MSLSTLTGPTGRPSPAATEAASAPASTSRRARLLAFVLIPDHLALLLIVIATFTITAWNVAGGPDFQDDEGTYTAQASAVQRGDLAPYTYWYDHPPLGWIQLAVMGWLPGVLGLGGGTDIGAMRFVIAGFFTASSALIFLIVRRMRGHLAFAVVSSAVFVLSPLSQALGRQVYLDAIAIPWLLLSIYTALSPRRALWHHVSAGVFFAVAVLSKITFAVFGPAILVAMLDRVGWRGRAFSIVGFLSVGALVLAMYPLMAALRGELFSGAGHVSLQDGMAYQFLSRSGSGWLWETDSHRFLLMSNWMAADGFLVVAGLAAALVCATTRRTRWVPVALACFALPIVGSQGYLPAMYIVGGIPFLAIAVGVAADLVWRWTRAGAEHVLPQLRSAGSILVVAVLAGVIALVPVARWADGLGTLLTTNANADWQRTLDYAESELPHDSVVLVPYSMWQDLDASGWNDPWKAIVLEKVDLDSRFAVEHPDGWQEIDWVIEGPTVAPNIEYLGLDVAGQALDHSEVVQTFGSWNIRRVIHSVPPSVEP